MLRINLLVKWVLTIICLPYDWVYSLNKEADKGVEHEEDIQSTQARTDIAT
jgi:hypothetical protein